MADPFASATPPSPGYDTSRVSTRGVFWFLIFFALTGVALLAALWWYQSLLLRHTPVTANAPHAIPPATVPQPLQPSPGHPLLPWQDMAALRATQEARLHSAGPLLNDPTHRRIPIDEAIDRLLRSGDLAKPWQNTTQPYQYPATQRAPTVENRT
jgi:hypothetical protein